jgi:hypothetical protein
MVQKLYVDMMSQPSRAVLLFCRLNDIPHEVVSIRLANGEHRAPAFRAVNPMMQVGPLKLCTSSESMIAMDCRAPAGHLKAVDSAAQLSSGMPPAHPPPPPGSAVADCVRCRCNG